MLENDAGDDVGSIICILGGVKPIYNFNSITLAHGRANHNRHTTPYDRLAPHISPQHVTKHSCILLRPNHISLSPCLQVLSAVANTQSNRVPWLRDTVDTIDLCIVEMAYLFFEQA